VREVLYACEEVVGRPIPHEVAERRPGDPPILVASPARIQQELGWQPQYTNIRDIVATAWRWHEAHPQGYASGA
jgi:UDP-glucose 4-epimerase